MAELRLENYFLAFMIFTLMIVAGMGIVTNVNKNYNLTIGTESEFNTTYRRANETFEDTYSTASGMQSDVYGAPISEDTTENSMFKGAFKAIRNSMGIFGIVTAVITDIGGALGIPGVFMSIAIAAFLIILAMALIYLVFRFRP